MMILTEFYLSLARRTLASISRHARVSLPAVSGFVSDRRALRPRLVTCQHALLLYAVRLLFVAVAVRFVCAGSDS